MASQKSKSKVAPIKIVVDISDLHCGGTTALMPPDFELIEGQKITQNIAQEWLWERFLSFVDRVMEISDGSPFALVLNGDMIEGNHHRTKQIISPDENDHLRCAYQCLKPLLDKAAKVFFAEGTECHTHGMEQSLSSMFGAVSNPNNGKPAWDRVDITVHGCRCIFHHHMPTTSREWLRPNAVAQMFANEQIAAARAGEQMPKVLGMAHRHTADSILSAYGLAFSTPSWQLTTRHTGKVVPHAGQSRIEVGGAVLDWRSREVGDIPEYIPITYRSLQSKGVTL